MNKKRELKILTTQSSVIIDEWVASDNGLKASYIPCHEILKQNNALKHFK